jgi:hypothetical protein
MNHSDMMHFPEIGRVNTQKLTKVSFAACSMCIQFYQFVSLIQFIKLLTKNPAKVNNKG